MSQDDTNHGRRTHQRPNYSEASDQFDNITINSNPANPGENIPFDDSPRPLLSSRPQKQERPEYSKGRQNSLRKMLFAREAHASTQQQSEGIEMTPSGKHSVLKESKKQPGVDAGKEQSAFRKGPFAPDVGARRTPGHRIRQTCNIIFDRVRKTVLRIPEVTSTKDGRHTYINQANPLDERTGEAYIHNSIRSSRYSLVSFFPRQLFAQFSKLANAYFLIISIMQLIPGLSTTGQFTTIVPLIIFVGISMGKEGYDDLRRWKLDKEENNRTAYVLRGSPVSESNLSNSSESTRTAASMWAAKKWSEIEVGDIIRLQRDDPVPADMILMYAEGGTAYMETMALDGETNLKNKQAPGPLLKTCQTLEATSTCRGEIVVEDPSMDLYRFEGKISTQDASFPLTTTEILYRGSTLRNTPAMAGFVCYTGEECRIRQNANKNPRIKAPALQGLVNKIVILIASFVLVLSLGCSGGYSAWGSFEDNAWYLDNAGVAWGQVLASFIIMFNTLLPLSLYVSMEIVKVFQIFLMDGDVDLYDEASNTPMQCQTSTINEELGQVSYIFSDKTGTLTKNEMKIKKISCGGYVWSHMANAFSTEVAAESQPADPAATAISSTKQLMAYIIEDPTSPLAKQARQFVLSIALCHTCIPEKRKGSEEIQFQASSPDELALVVAAQEMGYLVMNRDAGTVTIQIHHDGSNAGFSYETYKILHVIEFTSSRKRMSVVVEDPDGHIWVHSKGADTVIRKLLRLSDFAAEKARQIEQREGVRKSMEANNALRRQSTALSEGGRQSGAFKSGRQSSVDRRRSVRYSMEQGRYGHEGVISSPTSPIDENSSELAYFTSGKGSRTVNETLVGDESWVAEQTLVHLNDFAHEGLRTLLHAARHLGRDEYRKWAEAYHEATTSLSDREDRISEVANRIENGFELVGASAIEDKLQDGVPETIDRLRRANIRMWMLTGDKRETAISISRSCKLTKDYSTMIVLDHLAGDVEQRMSSALLDISENTVAHGVLVVDGETLATIETSAEQKIAFLKLAVLVDSVICCRASPSQKAMLVKSIRRQVNGAVTLAIGDGANDVAMIQEADVGIGISGGKEGLQAARTSDYAIAQFRFLNKLLLVHGRYNYDRICKYILATTYKEMVFYMTQALYQRYNGYTGTSLYESWSLSWYNTLFTSLPVIWLGSFLAELSQETLLAVPELYRRGQQRRGFNFKIWLWWTFMASTEAVMVYFIMYSVYAVTPFTLDNGLYAMGVMTYTSCVIIVNLKLQILEIHNKNILAAIAIFLSVGIWFVWNVLLSAVYKNNVIYNVADGFLDRFGRNALWWLTLIVIVVCFLLFELAIKAVKVTFFPSDVEIFQVLEQDPLLRKRFEDEAAPLLRGNKVDRLSFRGVVAYYGDLVMRKRVKKTGSGGTT